MSPLDIAELGNIEDSRALRLAFEWQPRGPRTVRDGVGYVEGHAWVELDDKLDEINWLKGERH